MSAPAPVIPSQPEPPHDPRRPNVFTHYALPGAPWWNVDIFVRWEEVAAENVFLAMHHGFEGGFGGYIGLQHFHSGARKAIFSIWGADTYPLSRGDHVEDNGTATRTIIDYPWVAGREYRLRIWSRPAKSAWVGSVQDVLTRRTHVIGTIVVPTSYGGLGGFVNTFTEYFVGGAGGCGQPYNRATWRGPYAQNQSVRATGAWAQYPPVGQDCSNADVRSLSYPVVVHETGGTSVSRTTRRGERLW